MCSEHLKSFLWLRRIFENEMEEKDEEKRLKNTALKQKKRKIIFWDKKNPLKFLCVSKFEIY
jgi:hypothetical protein